MITLLSALIRELNVNFKSLKNFHSFSSRVKYSIFVLTQCFSTWGQAMNLAGVPPPERLTDKSPLCTSCGALIFVKESLG